MMKQNVVFSELAYRIPGMRRVKATEIPRGGRIGEGFVAVFANVVKCKTGTQRVPVK